MKSRFSPCLLTSSMLALGLSCAAQADTVFGIYAGAGSWNAELEGNVGDPAISMSELGASDERNHYYYIAIEHPLPLIPNVKLQYNDISSQQTATIDKTFELDGTEFTAGSRIHSDFDLSYTDATLYYEILDNWFNLDLGLTLRKYSGHLTAEAETVNQKIDVDLPLPLVYGRFQFDLPFTGLSAGFEGNYISYKDSTVSDYAAKISYVFDSVMDFGIEAGYRAINLEVYEDDVEANLELKGPYIAAIFHF